MNFTNTPTFLFLFLSMLTAFNLIAQDKKEATVLYNTHPVKAVIDTETKSVDYIINSDEEFMKGFQLEIPDYEKHLLGQAVIAQEDTSTKKSIVSEVLAYDLFVDVPSSQDYSIDNNLVRFISFTPGFATLSDEAIRKLESVIDEHKKSSKNILLKTISLTDTDQLSVNRINAIKTYLKIRGIDTNAVSVTYLIGDKNKEDVIVEFKN
jgi:hypothetical protein